MPKPGIYTQTMRRSIGRALIPKFIKLGFNRRQGMDYLKEQGAGYRKTIFLKDWAQLLGMKQKADPLKYVRKGYLPTPDTITPTYDRQEQKYKYIHKAEILDRLTGERKEQYISIGADYMRPMGVMDEMAAIIASSFKYGEQIVLLKLDREAVLELQPVK